VTLFACICIAFTLLLLPRRKSSQQVSAVYDPASDEITPAEAFGVIAQGIKKRIQTLQSISHDGYAAVISDLDVVAKQARKAQQYFIAHRAR
jgi:hypothetical protein